MTGNYVQNIHNQFNIAKCNVKSDIVYISDKIVFKLNVIYCKY